MAMAHLTDKSYNTAQGPICSKFADILNGYRFYTVRLGIAVPYTQLRNWSTLAYELIERNGMKEAYVRPLILMDKNMTLRADSEHPNVSMTCWNGPVIMIIIIWMWWCLPWRRPHPRTTYIDSKIVGHYTYDILGLPKKPRYRIDEGLCWM